MDAVKESIHIYFMQAIAKVSCFKSEILLQVSMYLFKHFRIKSSHFVTNVWLSNEINTMYLNFPTGASNDFHFKKKTKIINSHILLP